MEDLERCASASLACSLNDLDRGASLTLIGIDASNFRSRLDGALTKHILLLDLEHAPSVPQIVGRVLDDLASLVSSRWPDWPDTTMRDAPSRPRWRSAAAQLAAAGRSPRFRRLAREIEIGHLLSVLPPLVLVAEIDLVQAKRAMATITALEWCRRFVGVAFLLPQQPPALPPWQRILHRAILLDEVIRPVAARFISPTTSDTLRGSWIERRLRLAIQADVELAGLFENEIVLTLEPPLGLKPRVDLLWRAGRVIVEIDGPEHGRDSNYGADRHRDYELMLAGYLVLRITNAEVELDLERALDKVRNVVNLRRPLS